MRSANWGLAFQECKVKIPAQRQIVYTSGTGLNPVSYNIMVAISSPNAVSSPNHLIERFELYMATLTVDASKNIGDVNLFKDYNNLRVLFVRVG